MSRFLIGLLGGGRRGGSNSSDGSSSSGSISGSGSTESEMGTPPNSVRVGGQLEPAHTDITNFTQDSYEQFERPKSRSKIKRPSNLQERITSLPPEEEYLSVGKIMSKRSMHRIQQTSRPPPMMESRDDYESEQTSAYSDAMSAYSGRNGRRR